MELSLPFSKGTTEPLVPQGTPVTAPTVDPLTVKRLSELERQNAILWNRLQSSTPVTYRVVASGSFVTGQPLILSFGGPDQGTFWEVNCLAIGGTDINVTAAGSFGLYVSGFQSNVSPGMGALVDGANSAAGGLAIMPFTETYGARQIVINDSENLYAIIYNGTNGQQYVANIQASVYNVASAAGNSVNII